MVSVPYFGGDHKVGAFELDAGFRAYVDEKIEQEREERGLRIGGENERGPCAKPGDVSMGTTIMAMKFAGGVILASDSATTTGTVFANRYAKKLTYITDNIFMARAGSASDTQMIAHYLIKYLRQYQIDLSSSGGGTKEIQVRVAASLVKLMAYNNRAQISGTFIVAGVDSTGPHVFKICDGYLVESDMIMAGSGSLFIYGLADSHYRKEQTKETALDLAQKLVNAAMMRDHSSGGLIRWVVITKDGYEQGSKRGEDVVKLQNFTQMPLSV